MKSNILDLLKKSLIRALYTFAETAAGMIVIGSTLAEVNWLHIASVSAVAAIISFLKSIIVGVPESGIVEGTITIDNSNTDDPKVDIDLGSLDLEEIVNMKSVKMAIVNGPIDDFDKE